MVLPPQIITSGIRGSIHKDIIQNLLDLNIPKKQNPPTNGKFLTNSYLIHDTHYTQQKKS